MSQERPARAALVLGTYREANRINEQLKAAEREMHLVTPFTSIGAVPEGFAVAFTAVRVDPVRDTYPIQGSKEVGVGKFALERISAALGISWDPFASGRMDDASDAHYCRWLAVGTYKGPDAQIMTLSKNREVDLRDGSPEALTYTPARLQQARRHVQSLAESKAQLRAVRQMGLRIAYFPEELDRPFVAVRMVFTGESSDPALAREFALLNAKQALGIFGQPAPAPRPAVSRITTRHAPPPVGHRLDRDDDDDDDRRPYDPQTGEMYDTHGESVPFEDVPQERERPARPASPKRSGVTIPRAKDDTRNVPIEEADIHDLYYWQGRFRSDLDGGKSRNAQRDRDRLAAVSAEIKRREAGNY